MKRQKAEKIARDLFLLFDLTDYRVKLKLDDFQGVETDDGMIVGETFRYGRRLEATIKLAMQREPAAMEETIRHEVCHVLLGPMRDVLDTACSQLTPQGSAILVKTFVDAEEQAAVRICRAIARLKGERNPSLG